MSSLTAPTQHCTEVLPVQPARKRNVRHTHWKLRYAVVSIHREHERPHRKPPKIYENLLEM